MQKLAMRTALVVISNILAASIASAQWIHRAPRVMMVTPEQTDVLQSGGLAHAGTGLAKGLIELGMQTEVIMPYYLEMKASAQLMTSTTIPIGLDWRSGYAHKQSNFSIHSAKGTAVPTVLLRHENHDNQVNYFDNRRPVNDEGKKVGPVFYSPDFQIGESFGAFAKAAADYILSQNVDLVILNDWTTGLVAVYLAEAQRAGMRVPRVVFAIHNIAYQGVFEVNLADFLGLDRSHFNAFHGYEFFGRMNMLKAGMQYSDYFYTVSQQYSEEIATPRFGAGLDGVVRQKKSEGKVAGILNGIINEVWDPRLEKKDLKYTFSVEDLRGKRDGKMDLQRKYNLPVRNVPVFTLTSRMAEQKGFEYLIDAISDVISHQEAQFIVIGDGDAKYIAKMKELTRQYPDKVRVQGFSEHAEAELIRYSDFFVNAAWFEPSGLNQFFALINGTVPVVSEAGGLKDSVKDGKNGVTFEIVPAADGKGYDIQATRQSVARGLSRAIALYSRRADYQRIQANGMREDNSWKGRIISRFIPYFQSLQGAKGFGVLRTCSGAHGAP